MDDAMPIAVDRKLLKWGNGYGVRLTAAEVASLGLKAGMVVHAQVGPASEISNDVSRLPRFNLALPPGDLDDYIAETSYLDYLEKERRSGRGNP